MLWSCAARTCKRALTPHCIASTRRTIATTLALCEKDNYDILGVAKTATPEEIKEAYLEKTKVYRTEVRGSSCDFLKTKKAYEGIQQEHLQNGEDKGTKGNKERPPGSDRALIFFLVAGLLFYLVNKPRHEITPQKKDMKKEIKTMVEHYVPK